jgi:hypothetical protein
VSVLAGLAREGIAAVSVSVLAGLACEGVAAGVGLVLVAVRALQSHARASIHPVLVVVLLSIALLVVLALLVHQGAVNQ